ncbi:MAG: hypothetical protein E7292_02060 [Lachnospiraceae bacterium]|nr:hypothetical protein [Lachnospiraceae bacterium]
MKKLLWIFCCVLGCLGLVACGQSEPTGENVYQIYVVSNSETKVETHSYAMQATESAAMLDELTACLSTQPDKLEYKVPFAMGFEILSMDLKESKLIINVDGAYMNMPATTEVLVRAAIVRTLTQHPDVKYVGITVEGQELFDQTGEVVGLMSAETFINNDGNEINTYEPTRVKLYFANATGDKLIGAHREKYYSTNVPLERFVVEELIAGPSGKVEGLYPTINREVKIISVMTKDGICYVNLDASFLSVVNNVSTELSIYSIVNSLVELSTVNKVQILINGEVPESFGSAAFERNLDCVTTLESENMNQ